MDDDFYALPDGYEDEDYILATYFIKTEPNENIIEKTKAIAIEQTTGTWTPVPGETPDLRKRHLGKVVSIWETPDYELEINKDADARYFIFQVAYPVENIGLNLPLLLTTTLGEISFTRNLKLVDISFPRSFLAQFPGPRFGIDGIRKILNVQDRPLLNNMIKPCTGYSPEVGRDLFYEVARGGVDIIKDDELLCNMPFNQVVDRVKLNMEAVRMAYEEKKEMTLYTVNVSDRPDRCIENARRAVDVGANAIMVNYLTVGPSILSALAEDDSVNVPILAHLNFAGAISSSSFSGVSSHLILGKIPRIAGADMVIYPAPYGKCSFLNSKYIKVAQNLTLPLSSIESAWPIPSAGIYQGVVPQLIKDLGNDCIIAAGGAIHGHPMGPKAGATAFRQAIDAVMKGVDLREKSQSSPELKAALDLWGMYGEENKDLFKMKKG